MSKGLAIYGFGGHAREVAFQMKNVIERDQLDLQFYVDDQYANEIAKPISEFNPEERSMMVAVADPKDREEMVKRLPAETEFFTFIHHAAMVFDLENIEIGEGSFIGAFSLVTTNVNIGKHSILNRGNQIGHDTIVGDYLSMMPGAIISGNVTAGDRLYMGTNSSIREKLEICNDVTVGLNSGIVKNIKEPGIYVGLPAKKLA
jgi:sugar O-acyltransferase (sialic acid O-acetyltransferase NeuD family)